MRLATTNVILVPTDFTAAADLAIEAAVELAELLRAGIELLHVSAEAGVLTMTPESITPVELDVERAMAAQSARLDATAERIRRHGLKCSVGLTMGRTHTEIIDHAIKIGAGLIVLGSHEHRGVASAFLANVSEKVVRHAPCAVLVVPLLEPAANTETHPLSLATGAALIDG